MKVIIKQHPGTGLWVSSDGRVVMPPCPNIHRFKHTWTFGHKDMYGYLRVRYHGKYYHIHRLVAETHIPNPEGYPTVDHINRIKTDNRADNLRWASYKMQADNRQICEDSLAKYGVRFCENRASYNQAYNRVRHENNPGLVELDRIYHRGWYAKNAEQERARYLEYQAKNIERERARKRAYQARQRKLGKRQRKCPDGKYHLLTDAEYNARFGNESQQLPLF